MKKLFVLVFAIALCLGALCFGASADHIITLEEPTKGTGSPEDPYKIEIVGHLYWFADYVNKGNSGACAELTNNIYINWDVLTVNGDLNDLPHIPANEWIPINNFSGTFDGQGYTIHGLYLTDTDESAAGGAGGRYYTGMFREIVGNGTVKNLNLVDSYIAGSFSKTGKITDRFIPFTGGICGHIGEGATVSGCTFNGTLYADTSTGLNTPAVGGICGYNQGTLVNCEFRGKLGARNDFSTPRIYALSYEGGICGWNHGTVEDSDNFGTITGMGYNPAAGGICAKSTGTIENCINNAQVSSITDGTDGNSGYAGGIVADGSGTIKYCKNESPITGANYAGGIVGQFSSGSIISCTNSETIEAYYQMAGGICAFVSSAATISGCTNSAEVKITDRSAGGETYLGGICGKVFCFGAKIVNCYNSGNLSGYQENADTMNIGGICGGTEMENLSNPQDTYAWNCWNTGSITSSSPGDGVVNRGGVCGKLSGKSFVENCFWLDRDGSGKEDPSAMSPERTARGEAAGSLNGWTHGEYNGKVWKVGDDGYPVLAGGSNDVVEVQFRKLSDNALLMLCCTNKGEKLKGIDSIDESTQMLYDAGDSGVYAITVSELKEMTFSSDAVIILPQGMKQVLTVTVKGTASKVYDGSNAVTDASDLSLELSGIMIGDDVSATAASYIFDDERCRQPHHYRAGHQPYRQRRGKLCRVPENRGNGSGRTQNSQSVHNRHSRKGIRRHDERACRAWTQHRP